MRLPVRNRNHPSRFARPGTVFLAALVALAALPACAQEHAAPGTMPELPAVVVTGASDRDFSEFASEFLPEPALTVGRLPLPPEEIPQASASLTRQTIDDLALDSLDQIATAVPGLSHSRGQFYARGQRVVNLAVDGLVFGQDKMLEPDDDLLFYERIDITRGAGGLGQGTAMPSATLNLQRKRPTAVPAFEFAAAAGSWSRRALTLDAGGPLDAAGRLRGRFVAGWRAQESWRDYLSSQRDAFQGVLEADLGSRTRLTVGASRQKDEDDDSLSGIPTAPGGGDLRLPRETYLGNAWERMQRRTTHLFASLDHAWANGWRIRLDTARREGSVAYLGTYLNGGPPGAMRQNLGQYDYRNRQESHALNLNGPFRWLGRRHELSAGFSRRAENARGGGLNVNDYVTGIDVRDWNWRRVPRPDLNALPAALMPWHYSTATRVSQSNAWLAARFGLTDDLKLILGLRADRWQQRRQVAERLVTVVGDFANAAGFRSSASHFGHYAGLTWEADARHTLYLSRGDTFFPQPLRTADGRPLDPARGHIWETGIKARYLDGRLQAGLALYRSEQDKQPELIENQTALCPSWPAISCYRASGAVRTQGLEIDLHGTPLRGWQLAFGYALSDSRYRQDGENGRAGQRFDPQLPRHQLKLTTLFRLPGGQWRIGGNALWQSATEKSGYDNLTATWHRIRQPAYAIAGLVVGWQNGGFDLQFNIDNLTDRRYYQSIEAPNFTAYGPPRRFLLTARQAF